MLKHVSSDRVTVFRKDEGMGAKVRLNARTGAWEVVREPVDKIVELGKVEVEEKPRGAVIVEEGEVVGLAPLLKGRMKNDVDELAGADRFVLSGQIHVESKKVGAKVGAESVAEEIEALTPEEVALMESLLGGK